jgi:multiple sugar transport system ATP-binding protein
LRNTPRTEIDRRVRETARLLGIEHLLERRPRQLSGGERQRVALGRAIVRRARLFLMDEPLSNLDAQLRIQMRREIIHLQRQLGITTIYVTHDQVEAMTMGDRIVVMRGGVVQQVGDPVTIYNHPANRFVARFIGSPPMNLFNGVLENTAGVLQLRTGFATYPLPPRLTDGLLRSAVIPVASEVVCGIRAEDVAVSGEGVVQPDAPTGVVDLVEPLGSDVFVSVALGADLLLARASPDLPIKEAQTTSVTLNLTKLHLFAVESGENLLIHR